MTKPDSVIIPFPKPHNPPNSHVADNCSLKSAAEYRAVSLAKLLRRMPESELTNSASTLLSELILLYHLAIAQAAGSIEHD